MLVKISKLCLSVVLFLCLVFVAYARSAPPREGAEMPQFKLPVPESKIDRKYLGIADKKADFTVSDIKADVVIAEIFSMYCPHCQRSAPDVNKLYEDIQKNPALKDRVKIFGIGIGNSQYEIDFFKKKYNIPFPLIPDGEFKLYKEIGVKRTPYFIAVMLMKDGKSKVFYSKPGGFDSHKKFLEMIIRLSGLKCSK
ncbi:MAG TPA: TlpA family protein disulfide reductase [Deltaproteobacteria bacterium]|nr:TlpA family protein disulfide reductase [Deltaproteobacteria bacterium]